MRRHRFVTSWVYDIPGPTTGALSHAIGGWQVTGIYQWQSGQPYTITSGVDNAGWGLGDNRAIRTGQPLDAPCEAHLTQRRARSGSTRPHLPSTRTGRSAKRSEASSLVRTARRSIWGCSSGSPSRTDLNLQFRAEFFNLFNTVNFNNPAHDGELGGDIRPDHRGAGSTHHAVRVEVPVLTTKPRRHEGTKRG